MDNVFLLRVILSFLIAGAWIATSTIIAEKFGSKIGGLVSNLPSNIMISMIFITIVNDVEYLRNIVPGIPVGLVIDTIFMLVFIVLLRYSLIVAVSISLLVWFCLAAILFRYEFSNLIFNVIAFFVVSIPTVLFIEKRVKVASMNNSKKSYSLQQIIYRTTFGGAIVASIVVISRFCDPYLTGILSAFPAMLLSTLIILTINQSKEFAMATGKVLVLSLSNILVYALAVFIVYPRFGILVGTIIAYSFSAVWVLLLHPLAKKMI
jgi:uncharacterized membrane protein (GlpM family)